MMEASDWSLGSGLASDWPGSQDAGLETFVNVRHQTCHLFSHLLVLFRHIDVVKKVGCLHHPKYLLHPRHGLLGEMLRDQGLEEALQLRQVGHKEGPVIRVIRLKEAHQGHRDCVENFLDFHQNLSLLRTKFISPQKEPDLD